MAGIFGKTIIAKYNDREIKFRDEWKHGIALYINGLEKDRSKKLFSIPFVGKTRLRGVIWTFSFPYLFRNVTVISRNMGVFFKVEFYVGDKLIHTETYV